MSTNHGLPLRLHSHYSNFIKTGLLCLAYKQYATDHQKLYSENITCTAPFQVPSPCSGGNLIAQRLTLFLPIYLGA